MKQPFLPATLIGIIFLASFSFSQAKPRIAVLQLKNENAAGLEVSVISHLIRNFFVNTDRFVVLDREDMDKILKEQSMYDFGVATETDAVRYGKILNVEKIVIGTLMNFKGDYLIEVRMINVETSSIEKSSTETFPSSSDFEKAARRIVEKIGGVHVGSSQDSNTLAQPASGTAQAPSSAAAPDSERVRRDLRHWTASGFTSDDYARFTSSGSALSEWIARENKSPVVAGLMGALPAASGSYYTHNYGLAIFFSLVKVLSIAGMTQTWAKGGEDKTWFAAYAVTYSACSVVDVIASAHSAGAYNANLDRLSRAMASYTLTISDKPGISATISF